MPVRTFKQFIKLEASGGIILLFTAIIAIIIDNTGLHNYYQALIHTKLDINLGLVRISKPLLLWINDGLMTIFFLLVGCEVKRELFEGELNSLQKASLPGFAAIGGMIIPALIYYAFNHSGGIAARGWAIPAATDIAFSLGILSLVGKRVPGSLKVFLTALAIFDDIGAIVIIAIFYSGEISLIMLLFAGLFCLILLLLNRLQVKQITPYIVVGLFLWVCVLKSGVHATLAGIILSFALPLRIKKQPDLSPLRKVEHRLHPWVAYGVLPIFAFANAGVSFAGLTRQEILSPVTLGIAAGLFIGKQLGIWGICWAVIKLGWARMPKGTDFFGIYGIALLAGIGFTMSLFIGSLAFGNQNGSFPAMVRLGVIVGSLLSGLFGYLVLLKTCRRQVNRKANG